MAVAYSTQTCQQLRQAFDDADVSRSMRVERYDPGEELTYNVTGVVPSRSASVRLRVEKFVGGGFAGQVYRVEILAVEGEEIVGLSVGGRYAMKILIPPASGSVRFRNLVYAIGFQAPFQLQVNPVASRCGALWQKFIRRAAGIEYGSERAVVDILATFVDDGMGSCGELSEWLEGRTWRFEVDDDLSARRKYFSDDPAERQQAGSPEYMAKKDFMARLVRMLHRMGAPELARQYEWWSCKSQPNCLKRLDSEGDPAAGLTAVDFRAGLALLPCLPMSPGDFQLILAGVFKRGSLVQFDRGDVDTLRAFVASHGETFADMTDALEELAEAEGRYRDSQIDVTHNHVRLLSSRRLWGTILDSAVQSWRIRNMVDDEATEKLSRSRCRTVLFALAGLLAGVGTLASVAGLLGLIGLGVAVLTDNWPAWSIHPVIPAVAALVGGRLLNRFVRGVRSLWGRVDLRRHWSSAISSRAYLGRAFRAHAAERLACWHREGRLSGDKAMQALDTMSGYLIHSAMSRLPVGLHRAFTDGAYLRERLADIVVRPIRLYFNADAREQWLLDMLDDGLAHGMLSEEEAEHIRGQLKEPFIQKYLKSLAVHVCTLPVTQVISVTVAIGYKVVLDISWAEAWPMALLILATFQITPISPGSMVRGLYVVSVVVRERNYRDYKLAVWMGFWKYIGYLSFPLQMAYRYPAIARFMAGRWATGAVHVLPVFGERGALAEHAVFDLFYNRPLTIRRRLLGRAKRREGQATRWWHVPICAAVAWFGIAQAPAWRGVLAGEGFVPGHSRWLLVAAALIAGVATSWLAGGAKTGLRILMGLVTGLLLAVTHVATVVCGPVLANAAIWGEVSPLLLPAFGAALLTLIAAAAAELCLPEPKKA